MYSYDRPYNFDVQGQLTTHTCYHIITLICDVVWSVMLIFAVTPTDLEET